MWLSPIFDNKPEMGHIPAAGHFFCEYAETAAYYTAFSLFVSHFLLPSSSHILPILAHKLKLPPTRLSLPSLLSFLPPYTSVFLIFLFHFFHCVEFYAP